MHAVDPDHMAAVEHRRVRRIETEFGQRFEHFLIEHLQLDARKVRPQAAVRANAEGDVDVVLAPQLKSVGRGEFGVKPAMFLNLNG